VPASHHECREGNRPADQTVVDRYARRLDAGAEERIGSAPDAQPAGSRGVQHLPALVPIHPERLLGEGVLSRRKRLQRDRRVGLRDGQVEHDIDVRIGDQLVDGKHARHAELLRARACPIRVEIRARRHVQRRKLRRHLEIRGADRSTPHHSHSYRTRHRALRHICRRG
jgi:hypothetical protein